MRRSLWSGEELTRALDLETHCPVDVDGISIDSRTLRPDDLFIALSGTPDPRYLGAAGSGRDGHDFVADAARRGAAAALVSRRLGSEIPELLVTETFDALWTLARAARDRVRGTVFAITGSSGKTTAKGMLAASIAGSHCSEGSFNNHIGVPLSLARMPADAASGVFEIGMNSPGEIAPLARLVRPDVALVLNVLGVHLEGLGSLEAIRREKLSIAAGLDADGVLVVADDVSLHDLECAGSVLTFGRSMHADVRLEEQAGRAAIRLPDGRGLPLELADDGPHRRMTATAIAACHLAAGSDPETALERIQRLQPPVGRGNVIEVAGVKLIDDSYNANPDSMRLAVSGLLERPARRRYALLGDMLELGPDEVRLHRELATVCRGLDGVFCVGERMAELHAALPPEQQGGWWPDCEAFDSRQVATLLRPGDVILIKASNRLFWKSGTVNRLAVSLVATPES